MDDVDDPDPGGPVHPSVFYGLWPRFSVGEDVGDPEDAVQAVEIAD
jgi:hypothetical protein